MTSQYSRALSPQTYANLYPSLEPFEDVSLYCTAIPSIYPRLSPPASPELLPLSFPTQLPQEASFFMTTPSPPSPRRTVPHPRLFAPPSYPVMAGALRQPLSPPIATSSLLTMPTFTLPPSFVLSPSAKEVQSMTVEQLVNLRWEQIEAMSPDALYLLARRFCEIPSSQAYTKLQLLAEYHLQIPINDEIGARLSKLQLCNAIHKELLRRLQETHPGVFSALPAELVTEPSATTRPAPDQQPFSLWSSSPPSPIGSPPSSPESPLSPLYASAYMPPEFVTRDVLSTGRYRIGRAFGRRNQEGDSDDINAQQQQASRKREPRWRRYVSRFYKDTTS